jgi:hypothetical protein
MGGRRKSRKRSQRESPLRRVSKSVLLCISMCAIWLFVMLIVGWYDPKFHLLATFSSAALAALGLGGGVVERLAS